MAHEPTPVDVTFGPPMEIADAELAASEALVDNTAGSVHSWDLVTGADGPGTRMTLFTAGCGLRCQFCQNPDTWRMKDGVRHTVDEVLARVTRYATVMKVTGGGLTISGGEPLLQAKFVTQIFRRAHDLNIHTALDTAGLLGSRLTDDDLNYIDLVLLDIKSGIPETYKRVTGRPLQPTLDFARAPFAAGQDHVDPLCTGARPHGRRRERRRDRQVCRHAGRRGAHGDPAVPPDGQGQVGGDGRAVPAGRHGSRPRPSSSRESRRNLSPTVCPSRWPSLTRGARAAFTLYTQGGIVFA